MKLALLFLIGMISFVAATGLASTAADCAQVRSKMLAEAGEKLQAAIAQEVFSSLRLDFRRSGITLKPDQLFQKGYTFGQSLVSEGQTQMEIVTDHAVYIPGRSSELFRSQVVAFPSRSGPVPGSSIRPTGVAASQQVKCSVRLKIESANLRDSRSGQEIAGFKLPDILVERILP